MKSVKVNKEELLQRLHANREDHRDLFLRAQEVYRERAIAELDGMLRRAREGDDIERSIRLIEPQDYTEEFDTAIEMIEWEVGDEVILDQREFKQYVQNEWGWMGNFTASTQAYVME